MTREEAKKILEAYIACESKKAHFECNEYNCDDSCPLLYDMGTVGEYNEAINIAIQALEQEPKTGHWIERRSRATGHIESVCSECGAEEGYPYNVYCGNCGVKMFESQESEDKE